MKQYSIFEATPGCSVLLSVEHIPYIVLAATKDYLKQAGLEAMELKGKKFWTLFPNADSILKESLKQVKDKKEPHRLNRFPNYFSNDRTIQSEKLWNIINTPVVNESGDVVYIIHSIENIDQKNNDSASSLGLEQAYNFFMAAPVIIGFVKGKNYVIELANERLLEVWARKSDVLGKPLLEAIPELKDQGFIELLNRVCETGEPLYAYEYPINLVRNGKEEKLFFDFVYKPYFENKDQKRALGVIAVGYDVTEKVQAKQVLIESGEELKLALEIADLGTFKIDLLQNKCTSSDKVNEWLGIEAQEYALSEALSRIHDHDRERVTANLEIALDPQNDSIHDVTHMVVHPVTGEVRHLRSFGKTLFNSEGKPYLVLGIIQNVTQQVLNQKELEQNEVELQKKVLERTIELENLNQELHRSNAALEQFAYAASHDLKEPIRKINYFAERIKHSLGDNVNQDQLRFFERMEYSVKRMNLLIDDLLTYSHISKDSSHFEDVDLNRKIQFVLEDLDLEIEQKNAKIMVGEMPTISANKRQMQQLFQNLIGNALKYTKPGIIPEITITSRLAKASEFQGRITSDNSVTQYHLIEIKDNGIGFHPDDAERIFHVFTRLHGGELYKGTGIGLSIAKKVVENHKGFIWAEAKENEGATFKILFPATAVL